MTRSAPPSSGTDPWSVLGLSPGADAATLKRAFRQQARRWHPDLNGNDPIAEEQFKRVNEAYALLSDPVRRRAWESGLDPRAGGGADPFSTGFPAFEDYLDALFGRNSHRRRQEAGGRESEPARDEPTATAAESGSAAGVTPAEPSPPPPVRAASDLETVLDLTPEQALAGSRVELELADGTVVELWTPPQAGDGWRLRLAGVAPGGADHFLQLRVRTAEGLRIDGLRVLYHLDLTPSEAALGCRVVVPTLDGMVQLRVPHGSSSGRLLRLRGRGLPLGEQRGDQLVEVRIVVPEVLGDAEAALYRRLQELSGSDRDDGTAAAHG